MASKKVHWTHTSPKRFKVISFWTCTSLMLWSCRSPKTIAIVVAGQKYSLQFSASNQKCYWLCQHISNQNADCHDRLYSVVIFGTGGNNQLILVSARWEMLL